MLWIISATLWQVTRLAVSSALFCYNENMSTTIKTPKRPAKGFTLGRGSFAKISAVEGIKLSSTMKAEFRSFDKQELSPDERRKALTRKYGKTR